MKDIQKLKRQIEKDMKKGFNFYEFGTRLKAEKRSSDDKIQEGMFVTKHLSEDEYKNIKHLLKGVDVGRY